MVEVDCPVNCEEDEDDAAGEERPRAHRRSDSSRTSGQQRLLGHGHAHRQQQMCLFLRGVHGSKLHRETEGAGEGGERCAGWSVEAEGYGKGNHWESTAHTIFGNAA